MFPQQQPFHSLTRLTSRHRRDPNSNQKKEETIANFQLLSLSHQANVMLSYPIPEAEELLTNKLSAAQQSLSNCEEDMDFLREQVTVS